jgi:superfamily II DNA/RNA helicase
VRTRQYLVEDVRQIAHYDTVVRLSCLDDDAQGNELEVLWEREVDAQILGGSSWDIVSNRGFDDPRFFSAYLHTLRWNCVTSTDPKLFQAPYRAGIEVMAYQLEPLRKALLMPRVNLFIADDVGLGKTVEAGLILREMLMRQKVRQVVIACPPSVVLQWKDEMERRFGLTFLIYDRAFVSKMRRERGYKVNPWLTHSRFIISQSLLRDEQYASSLRSWLGTFSPNSMLILDEAHNAAPASATRYAIDSKLTRIVRELSPRFEHRLFLSATPHNGHSNSFAALLELLDPQRFCRGVPIDDPKQLDAIMVRRLKSDLRSAGGDFPIRRVIRVELDDLPQDAPELELSRLLQRYRQIREGRLQKTSSRSQQTAAMLVITSLQKRLLSSAEAFACTLQVHRRAVDKQIATLKDSAPDAPIFADSTRAAHHPKDYALLRQTPSPDDDRAELSEEEVLQEEEAQINAATLEAALSSTDTMSEELNLLNEMQAIANQSKQKADVRVHYIIDWLRKNLCAGIASEHEPADVTAKWSDRRVIIFTEYTDTKRYLKNQLTAAIAGTKLAHKRIDVFHGGMGDESREDIKRAFNSEPNKNPLRILIATDAAREGVNLQNFCADLFHFDIPWNPSRMEQRNGRIDRKLQREKEVRCYYFVLPQRAEDRVLDVVVEKTRTIQEELGSLSPLLEKQIDMVLCDGIDHKDSPALRQKIQRIDQMETSVIAGRETIKAELEAFRETDSKLHKQLHELREILQKSRDWLNLDDNHFREAISVSLDMLGVPPIQRVDPTESDENSARWSFPACEQLPGIDPSWEITLDTLRAPRPRGQKIWEWRKTAEMLPLIFRDPGTLNADAVHLHLEHRLAQRLLGRFMSQGFVHSDLTRACVCMTKEALPKVIILGRLSMYGDRAARLHDEIIAVAAEWLPLDARGRRKLAPLGEMAKQNALQELENSLSDKNLRSTNEQIRRQFLFSVAQDIKDLLPHLEKRADILEKRAIDKLNKRGEEEAKDMIRILEKQRESISKMLDKQSEQLVLSFLEEERRQFEADRRYWPKRLAQIGIEIDEEPKRIKRAYEIKVKRVEPVGIVYLAPLSG